MADRVDTLATWVALTLGPPGDHNAVVICQVDTDDDVFAAAAHHLTAHNFHRLTVDAFTTATWPRADTGAVYTAGHYLTTVIIGDFSLIPANPMPLTGQWLAAGRNQGHTAITAVVRAGSLVMDRGHLNDGPAVVQALENLADRRGLLAARVDLVTIPIPTTEGAPA